jgi:glycosyltransferase involved in cell wall biosynthesis
VADPSSISIVIPAYNEEAAIADVVAALRAAAPWHEIVVVDDGSADATGAAAARAGAVVARHPYNKGNGAAVKSGIRRASGEYVMVVDGDGQHAADAALRIAARLGEYDLVVGARDRRSQASGARLVGNGLLNRLASYLAGHDIPDLTSGLRGARREYLRQFLHLLPNGFSTPTTTTLAFLRAGYNVDFVPIAARPRVGTSKIRLGRDGVKFVLILLRVITIFSPFRVFLPLSALAFVTGTAYGAWTAYFHSKIPNGAVLLLTLSVVVFLIGLLSEQIASLRVDARD